MATEQGLYAQVVKIRRKDFKFIAENKIKNEANRYWNDCKFQLHWHKLEWFNRRSQIKREKPIQFLQK